MAKAKQPSTLAGKMVQASRAITATPAPRMGPPTSNPSALARAAATVGQAAANPATAAQHYAPSGTGAQWAAVQAPMPAPAAPSTLVTRRAGAVTAVVLGKPYRVGAPHTAAAWAQVQAVCALHPAGAPVAACAKAVGNHPSPGGAMGFISYCVARGVLKAVA